MAKFMQSDMAMQLGTGPLIYSPKQSRVTGLTRSNNAVLAICNTSRAWPGNGGSSGIQTPHLMHAQDPDKKNLHGKVSIETCSQQVLSVNTLNTPHKVTRALTRESHV